MSSKQFSTRTDQRWYAAASALIGFYMAVFFGGIMWFWLHMIGPVLLVSGVFSLCSLTLYAYFVRQKNIPLHFYGNQLIIFHLDGLEYRISDIPARRFQFRQNVLERKYNVGRLKIKGTQFYLYGVQNFEETRRYILENFSGIE